MFDKTSSVRALILIILGILLFAGTADSISATSLDGCANVALYEPCTLFIDSAEIDDIAFSPDGRTLALVGSFTKALLLSIPEGETVARSIDNREVGSAVEFSPDGRLLAVGGRLGISLWDLQTDERTYIDSASPAVAISFSPDGSILAFSTENSQIHLYSFITNEVTATAQDNTFRFAGAVQELQFSPDGLLLGSNSLHGTKLWSTADLSLIHQFGEFQNLEIGELSFSTDSRFLAQTTANSELLIRDLTSDTYEQVQSLAMFGEGERGASGSRFFTGNNTIAVSSFEYATGDAAVRFWDLSTSTVTRELFGIGRSVLRMRVSSDEQFIATTSDTDADGVRRYVLLWRIAD